MNSMPGDQNMIMGNKNSITGTSFNKAFSGNLQY